MKTTLGNDLLDGQIANPRNIVQAALEADEHNTPSLKENDIPRGRMVHTGGGIWLKRCSECDDFVRVYGMLMFVHEMSQHERLVHSIEQTALLPK